MPSRRALTPGATRSASPADTVATVVELTCGAATLPGLPADLSLPQPFRDAALPGRRIAAFGLMLASGFAGLGYQVVWTQQSALWLGHEAAAVLAVVTAFFGGLALGALVLAPRIERSARPARWYAACEATIAVWSLVLIALLAPLSGWMLGLIGHQPSPAWQWAVAFVGTLVALLPATAAMGATLPAMERTLAPTGDGGRDLPALYACNTAGAVLGVLATAFWLVPVFGLKATVIVCVVLNAGCALAALRLEAPAASAAPATAVPSLALPLLAVTGLLGIGYEVLVVRVLSQVAEDTVYTFALLLAVYLVGTAAGAAAYQRWRRDAADPAHLTRLLLRIQAVACLIGLASLWGAEGLRDGVAQPLGGGMAAALTAEAVLALAAFLLPTLVMGALFSHLCLQARGAGQGFGRALGVNTAGAAAAPLLFGVLLAPWLGPRAALLLVVAGYLVLSWPADRRAPLFWAPAAVTLALALWAPPLAFVDLPTGGRIVEVREGPMAAVSIVEDADGVSRLRINNRQQEGSSATLLADARQALLPLLLHPAPQRVLFLGLGTGMTASAAAADLSLQVDAVELLPEVIAASAHFRRAAGADAANPRLHLLAADARRHVKTTPQRYDVVIADNFHPARSGSGSLYTVEHFDAVKRVLGEQGLFCQWLPLHQLDLDTLRSIVRSFVAVYPGARAMLATNSLETPVLGLVAMGRGVDLARLHERIATTTLPQRLAEYGLADEFALAGSFVAGPAALQQFAGDALLNTDDHPVVAYRAPRVTYAPDSLPRDRLLALLQSVRIAPEELLAGPDPASARRLAAYWTARDRFIEAGRDVRPGADLRRLLAQVREPLLAVLRISPDFQPAYDPLLRMASALARIDPAQARALLTELRQVQPARPEAGAALARIDSRPP
jgi:spermidine synthase